MSRKIWWLAGPLMMAGVAMAQRAPEVPLMRLDEAQVIENQAREFFEALKPTVSEAGASTVWVWTEIRGRQRQVAMGTAVGAGDRVLTKWSEIALTPNRLKVVGLGGKTAKATVVGVYEDQDLALLELEGAAFTPVKWATDSSLELGRMLVAAAPDEVPAAVGVVAVEKRSLREKDQAFLGVELDPKAEGKGLRIALVQEGSGAEEAGLEEGDRVLKVAGIEISSAFEMRSQLLKYAPGDRVALEIERGGKISNIEVPLKSRPKFQGFSSGRLRQMEQMGGSINLVRDGFPSVVQTDLKIQANQCGGPVVNLDGEVVGISIARADRTRSLVIPASEVEALLAAQPTNLAHLRKDDPQARENALALQPTDEEEGPGGRPAPQVVPLERGSAERFMKHLQDMEKLLDRMRAEMEGIE